MVTDAGVTDGRGAMGDTSKSGRVGFDVIPVTVMDAVGTVGCGRTLHKYANSFAVQCE